MRNQLAGDAAAADRRHTWSNKILEEMPSQVHSIDNVKMGKLRRIMTPIRANHRSIRNEKSSGVTKNDVNTECKLGQCTKNENVFYTEML